MEHIKTEYVDGSKMERSFFCSQCRFITGSRSFFDRHIKAVHLKIQSYQCLECPHAFSAKENLARHIKGVHHNTKDYICIQCEHPFSQKI